MAKKTKNPVAGLKTLDQPQVNKQLLVKNIYSGMVSISPLDTTKEKEMFLRAKEEKVAPASWASNPILRKFIESGFVSASWVDFNHSPKSYPDPQDAPPEMAVESAYERQFAMTIATAKDSDAVRLAQTWVFQPDSTEPDVPYMRRSLYKVMKLAAWLETQLDNRPAVLKALRENQKKIQDL